MKNRIDALEGDNLFDNLHSIFEEEVGQDKREGKNEEFVPEEASESESISEDDGKQKNA